MLDMRLMMYLNVLGEDSKNVLALRLGFPANWRMMRSIFSPLQSW